MVTLDQTEVTRPAPLLRVVRTVVIDDRIAESHGSAPICGPHIVDTLFRSAPSGVKELQSAVSDALFAVPSCVGGDVIHIGSVSAYLLGCAPDPGGLHV